VFLFFFGINYANNTQKTDTLATGHGDLTIHPIKHASLVLGFNNKTIYVDPTGGKEAYLGIAKPDIILITDIHPDHYDIKTIKSLNASNAILIVPKVVYNELPSTYRKNAIDLNNRQGVHRLDFFIEAVAMYNLPENPDAYHPKGRGNGYVITINDFNIYISGDTSATSEMKMLLDINIAFICMNQPYTMNIKEASKGVLAFNPKIVYPYHYRNKDKSLMDVKSFKTLISKKNPTIDVKLRDWY